MARIKCPSNVSSITLSTSGVLSPDAVGIITCTAAEATALGSSIANINQHGCATLVDTASNGDINISVPAIITSITINAVVYAVSGAATPFGKLLASRVPAPAASSFLYQNFLLVNG